MLSLLPLFKRVQLELTERGMMDVNVTSSPERAQDHEDSFKLVVAKTSVCMLVLALSLIENVIVLVVVKKDYRNRLRTADCYFIANMSIADTLFALQNIPLAYNNFIMKGHWVLQGHFGMLLCKVDNFFSLLSMVTVNLTILAIAGDQFCAMYQPFRLNITRRKCFLLIFLSWFISTLFSFPMLYYSDLQRVTENLTVCTIQDQRVLKIWCVVLTGILVTTLIMKFVLFTAIGAKIWRPKLAVSVSQRALTQQERRNRDSFKMVVILIVVFYICSLPLLVLQMSYALGFYTGSFCEGFKVTMGKCGRCRSSAYAPAHVLRRADGPLAPTNGLPRNCNAKQGDRKNGITSVNPLQSNKGTRKQHKTTRRQREANDCPYSS
ncbi:substance-P receptor-like isoform X3 [Acropora palmata]|uniref:substance-P receptor-like isoform X3 n=1 Tax=Acropora palmata TaxID=6131 RepID=UPI003DA07743